MYTKTVLINALQIIRNMERENQYVSEVRSLLESTTCGVIYTDSNMTITYVNKTAFDILHCYRDSVLQKPLTDILPSKIIERLQRSGGQESNIQLTIFDTDVIGNIFPLKSVAAFRAFASCLKSLQHSGIRGDDPAGK